MLHNSSGLPNKFHINNHANIVIIIIAKGKMTIKPNLTNTASIPKSSIKQSIDIICSDTEFDYYYMLNISLTDSGQSKLKLAVKMTNYK